jgi:hypothetical protein
MTGIFINYRSDDDDFACALVDERLRLVFGDAQVFLDSRSLPVGSDFPPELWHRLTTSTVLLVLIGRRWLTLAHESGGRRIDQPEDYVRLEIEEALKLNLRVIPVLLNDAALPAAADLPDGVKPLNARQYERLRVRNAEADLDHLVSELRRLVPMQDPPATRDGATTVYQHGGIAFNGATTVNGDPIAGNKVVRGGGA